MSDASEGEIEREHEETPGRQPPILIWKSLPEYSADRV